MKIYILLTLLLLSSCSRFSKSKKPPQKELKGYSKLIRDRLMANVGNIQFCYQRYLNRTKAKRPEQGPIKLEFSILKNGHVEYVKVKSSKIKNLKVKGCIVKAVTRIQFPSHKEKEYLVFQPFNLRPVQKK